MDIFQGSIGPRPLPKPYPLGGAFGQAPTMGGQAPAMNPVFGAGGAPGIAGSPMTPIPSVSTPYTPPPTLQPGLNQPPIGNPPGLVPSPPVGGPTSPHGYQPPFLGGFPGQGKHYGYGHGKGAVTVPKPVVPPRYGG
jgi:hypothetical protein